MPPFPRLVLLGLALAVAGCATRPVTVTRAPATAPVRADAPRTETAPATDEAAPDCQGGPGGVCHRVQAGQTLWRIARTYGVDLGELARVNRIEDPSRLEEGRVLWVPGVDVIVDVPTVTPAPPAAVAGEWRWPLSGSRLLSAFGAPRPGGRRHAGVDVRGRRGDAIVAARAGRVVFAGTMRGYGKTLIVDHGGGWTSLYAHNSRLLVDVGERVRVGESVARVGRTGNASTEHLHFEIRYRDAPVDPLRHLAPVAEAHR